MCKRRWTRYEADWRICVPAVAGAFLSSDTSSVHIRHGLVSARDTTRPHTRHAKHATHATHTTHDTHDAEGVKRKTWEEAVDEARGG